MDSSIMYIEGTLPDYIIPDESEYSSCSSQFISDSLVQEEQQLVSKKNESLDNEIHRDNTNPLVTESQTSMKIQQKPPQQQNDPIDHTLSDLFASLTESSRQFIVLDTFDINCNQEDEDIQNSQLDQFNPVDPETKLISDLEQTNLSSPLSTSSNQANLHTFQSNTCDSTIFQFAQSNPNADPCSITSPDKSIPILINSNSSIDMIDLDQSSNSSSIQFDIKPDSTSQHTNLRLNPSNTSSDHLKVSTELSKSSNQSSFNCPKCGKSLKNKISFRKHLSGVHPNQFYPCEVSLCGKKFKRRSDLFRHYRKVHKGVNFPCGQCKKLKNEKDLIVSHLQTYHEIDWSKLTKKQPANQVHPPTHLSTPISDYIIPKSNPFTSETVYSSLDQFCAHLSKPNPNSIQSTPNQSNPISVQLNVHLNQLQETPQQQEHQDIVISNPIQPEVKFISTLQHTNLILNQSTTLSSKSTHQPEPQVTKLSKSQKQTSVNCPKCGKFFTNKNTLWVHCVNLHPKLSLLCEVSGCGEKFETKNHLIQHYRFAHRGVNFPCDKCYHRKELMVDHLRTYHHIDFDPPKTKLNQSNPNTSQSTLNQTNPITAQSNVHLNQPNPPTHLSIPLSDCITRQSNPLSSQSISSNLDKLSFNLEKSNSNSTQSTTKINQTSFNCPECRKAFINEHWLTVHLHAVHSKQLHHCEVKGCVTKFKKMTNLLRHYSGKKHKGVNFPCNQCKMSRNRTDLLTHLRTYHKIDFEPVQQPRVACPKCEKYFTSQQSLNSHLSAVHPKQLLHCEVSGCGKSFKRNCRLLYHYHLVHKGVNFPCKQCKEFQERKDLMLDHLQIYHEICFGSLKAKFDQSSLTQPPNLQQTNLILNPSTTFSCISTKLSNPDSNQPHNSDYLAKPNSALPFTNVHLTQPNPPIHQSTVHNHLNCISIPSTHTESLQDQSKSSQLSQLQYQLNAICDRPGIYLIKPLTLNPQTTFLNVSTRQPTLQQPENQHPQEKHLALEEDDDCHDYLADIHIENSNDSQNFDNRDGDQIGVLNNLQLQEEIHEKPQQQLQISKQIPILEDGLKSDEAEIIFDVQSNLKQHKQIDDKYGDNDDDEIEKINYHQKLQQRQEQPVTITATQTVEKPFHKCQWAMCNTMFVGLEDLRTHVLDVHVGGSNLNRNEDSDKLSIEKQKTDKQFTELVNPIEAINRDETLLDEIVIDEQSSHISHDHIYHQTDHSPTPPLNANASLRCSFAECDDLIFNHPPSLLRHTRFKHSESLHPIHLKPFKNSRRTTQSNHVLKNISTTKFKCSLCDKWFECLEIHVIQEHTVIEVVTGGFSGYTKTLVRGEKLVRH